MYEHKLRKFASFVLVESWKVLRQDLEKRFSILSVKWIHFYFIVILNEMSILRTLITWESSTYEFAFRLTNKRILLSARQSPSVVIEWNLNLKEEYSILRILYCYSFQQHIFLHSATILTHTITCSHTFFSETKYCYSRSDVRSQLVPFSAIPRSWTWKRANLQALEIHRKLTIN